MTTEKLKSEIWIRLATGYARNPRATPDVCAAFATHIITKHMVPGLKAAHMIPALKAASISIEAGTDTISDEARQVLLAYADVVAARAFHGCDPIDASTFAVQMLILFSFETSPKTTAQ